ncbi:MAG: hypothetical protein PVJ98_08500 [Akkermansiaceae bacterium]
MKTLLTSISTASLLSLVSCAPTRPVGDVESLERQTPVTRDPNAVGDAINAGNAVNYSQGRRAGFGGFFGF